MPPQGRLIALESIERLGAGLGSRPEQVGAPGGLDNFVPSETASDLSMAPNGTEGLSDDSVIGARVAESSAARESGGDGDLGDKAGALVVANAASNAEKGAGIREVTDGNLRDRRGSVLSTMSRGVDAVKEGAAKVKRGAAMVRKNPGKTAVTMLATGTAVFGGPTLAQGQTEHYSVDDSEWIEPLKSAPAARKANVMLALHRNLDEPVIGNRNDMFRTSKLRALYAYGAEIPASEVTNGDVERTTDVRVFYNREIKNKDNGSGWRKTWVEAQGKGPYNTSDEKSLKTILRDEDGKVIRCKPGLKYRIRYIADTESTSRYYFPHKLPRDASRNPNGTVTTSNAEYSEYRKRITSYGDECPK